jgi:carboxymethylenebutenolidase
VPDEWLIEDVAAATDYLRSLTTSNGRVGVIGYGAGGRQAVLAARNVDFDAAVDCYGE